MEIAIVTGASSGLGREFVLQMDRCEVLDEIWVLARRAEKLEALQPLVHTRVRAVPCDLTQRSALDALAALLAREKPQVRLLVNAAGFGKIGSYRDISLEDCERMIQLNCTAAVAVTQLALPYMQRGARILEICSTSAFQPFQYLNVYAATKAFLYRYSRALRTELLGTGIRVTAVCPYWIRDTEFIGTAQKTGNSTYIKGFPLASRERGVVRRALLDSRLGLPVSTPGVLCTAHRIVAKVVPSCVMMGVWALLRRV